MKKIIILLSVMFCYIAAFSQNNRPELSTYNMQKGIEAYDIDSIDTAIYYFDKELSENPNNGYAMMFYGLCGFQSKIELQSIFDMFDKALKNISSNDNYTKSYIYSLIGNIYEYRLENDNKALKFYKKSHKIDVNNYKPIDDICSIYHKQENIKKLQKYAQEMISLDASICKGYYYMAIANYLNKDYKEAIKMCDAAIEKNITFSAAYILKGDIAQKLNDHHLAIESYLLSLELAYTDYSVYKIEEYLKSEQYEMFTVAKLRVYAMKFSESGIFFYLLGDYYESKDYYSKAIECYLSLNEIFPDDQEILYTTALCYCKIGDYENTINIADRMLEIDSMAVFSFYLKSAAYDGLGDYESAISYIDTAISKIPGESYNYYMKGRILEFKSDPDLISSLDNYVMSFSLDSTMTDAIMGAGRVYKHLGNDTEAEKCFKKVISMEQGKDTTEILLTAFAYQLLGEKDKAITIIQKILEENPTSSNFYNAACIYSLSGDEEKALLCLEEYFNRGYVNIIHVERDYDLDPIRDNDKYKSLIKEYKENKVRGEKYLDTKFTTIY